jgi:hypothetical protein
LTLTTDRGSITVRKSSGEVTPVKEPGALKRSEHAQVAFASTAPDQASLITLR